MSPPLADLTAQAQTLTAEGDLAGARDVLAPALDPASADPRQASPDLALAAALQARILIALGDTHAARLWAGFAHAAEDRLHGPGDERTIAAAATHAAVLHRVGNHGRAAQLYHDLVAELTTRDGPLSPRVLAAEADLATAEHAAGHCTAARTRLEAAWTRHREVYGDASAAGIKMLARLGAMERECARTAEASVHLALAQELCARYLPADHSLAQQIARLAGTPASGNHVCGRVQRSAGPTPAIPSRPAQSHPSQSRPSPSRPEQGGLEQGRPEQGGLGQGGLGQGGPIQGRSEQGRMEQITPRPYQTVQKTQGYIQPEQIRLEQGRPEQGRPDRDRPERGGSEQGHPDGAAGYGESGQGGPIPFVPSQHGAPDQSGPDQGWPDQSGPGKSGPDQGWPDQSGPDQGWPDQSGPDQSGPDQGWPDQSGPDQDGPDRGAGVPRQAGFDQRDRGGPVGDGVSHGGVRPGTLTGGVTRMPAVVPGVHPVRRAEAGWPDDVDEPEDSLVWEARPTARETGGWEAEPVGPDAVVWDAGPVSLDAPDRYDPAEDAVPGDLTGRHARPEPPIVLPLMSPAPANPDPGVPMPPSPPVTFARPPAEHPVTDRPFAEPPYNGQTGEDAGGWHAADLAGEAEQVTAIPVDGRPGPYPPDSFPAPAYPVDSYPPGPRIQREPEYPVARQPADRATARVPERAQAVPDDERPNRQPFILAGVLVAGIAAAAAIVAIALPRGDDSESPPAQTTPPAAAPEEKPEEKPAEKPAEPGVVAPAGVKLQDNRDSVELSWKYPDGSEGPVLISGGRSGQERRAFQQLAAGTTEYVVYGLNERNDYCFTVAVIYTVDKVAASEPVCTKR
ncbi:hypothetical protein [Actinoplanes sp. NPDC051494]|uniref:hypothetical protein n=1 Tax=Actinoplanes sp. NPDC051494 TaxID=3363907 RepID=UPI0037BA28A8